MTLNNLERRNIHYFAFFHRIRQFFQADYITVVEDRAIVRKILSPSFILPLLAKKYNAPCSAVSLAEHLVFAAHGILLLLSTNIIWYNTLVHN